MLSMVNIAGSRLVLNLKICATKGTVEESISRGDENPGSLLVFQAVAQGSQDTCGTLSTIGRPGPSRVFRQASIRRAPGDV
jgi:hypothetical protein